MVASTKKELSGWGKYPAVECEVTRPERLKSVLEAVDPAGTIVRGLGRSYGDTAVNSSGVVVDLTRIDRYLSFDEETGLLHCEAGVSLEAILRDFVPRGFLPRITPGTKFVTVGGCIANDIHGKAHHVDGTFANCVEAMRVLTAAGEVVTASRTENSDLFWASFGGVGLLGVILSAEIRLRPVESSYFQQHAFPVRDLDEMLDALAKYDLEYPYSLGWIDTLATGKDLGRGVLTVGDHARVADLPASLRRDPLAVKPPSPLVVPFDLPDWTLNGATIRVLNRVMEQILRSAGDFAHFEKFFYPLDFVGEWNRGYGSRGFTQYQFVIPFEGGRENLRVILDRIARSGFLPFLNVLKRFGPQGEGHLSFPAPGYTLAIDFPIADGLEAFLHGLDELVLDAGGRVYLAKDAFTTAQSFEKMYSRLAEWRQVKAKWDPDGVFTSDQARRVGLV